MPRRLLLASILALGLITTACSNDLLAIRVIALQPETNYPMSKDPDDAAQLTDGKTNSFPFWTKPDSVGWQQRTPVRISLQAAMKAGANYRLGILTANRDLAGVHPPRRIDAYCGSGEGLRHVAQWSASPGQFERDELVNLELALPGCESGKLELILHAQEQFLMLDEIILSLAPGAKPMMDAVGASVSDPILDSRTRLEKSLRAKLPAAATPRLGAWLSAPWGDLGAREGGERLDVFSLPTAGAQYVVGIHNGTDRAGRRILDLDHTIASRARISRLRAVLSADGQTVLDALEREAARSWDIPAGQSVFLMIQEPRGMASGQRTHRISDDQGSETSLRVQVTLLDRLHPEGKDYPFVHTWAYTNDHPIWTLDNAKQLMSELASAGVNVHVAPTRHIPMPFPPASQESEKRMRALADDIRLYKEHSGLILLFSGEALWNQIRERLGRPEADQALRLWAASLARFMADQGIALEQWALYLKDEPKNDDLKLLARVIPLLRQSVPQMRFYANPIPGRAAHALQEQSIRDLAGLVDYWQPRAGVAYQIVRDAIAAADPSRIWLYDNPCPPAKAALPSWYRGLARRAFDVNAHGIAFWSFSATNNSSAWDDLDGYRTDWAVVYEAKEGFVSSRRWEAFKLGVQEHAALRYCARHSGTNTNLEAQCRHLRASTQAQEIQCRD